MILEFVGLPGAGKTSCEKSLRNRLGECGVAILSETHLRRCFQRDFIYTKYRLNYGLRAYAPIRVLAYAIYRQQVKRCAAQNLAAISEPVLRSMSQVQRQACLWLAEDMLLADYYLSKPDIQASGIYLMPEGLVHHTAAVSVWAGPKCEGISRGWQSERKLDQLCVCHVIAPIDIALERFCRRGAPSSWPSWSTTTVNSIRSVLEKFELAIHRVVREFQQAGAQVFQIENNSDGLDVSSQVSSIVNQFTTAASGVS